mmetsp:Transcript_9033/g.19977  ORF Transcript_9033/g.19977 Transcript_9033/m.19977 type:complete len:215 (-) Transcript_9033:34-678(-)
MRRQLRGGAASPPGREGGELRRQPLHGAGDLPPGGGGKAGGRCGAGAQRRQYFSGAAHGRDCHARSAAGHHSTGGHARLRPGPGEGVRGGAQGGDGGEHRRGGRGGDGFGARRHGEGVSGGGGGVHHRDGGGDRAGGVVGDGNQGCGGIQGDVSARRDHAGGAGDGEAADDASRNYDGNENVRGHQGLESGSPCVWGNLSERCGRRQLNENAIY